MRTFALLLITALLLPAAEPLPIPWEMTTTAFMGKKAIVTLDTGARIEGNWIAVTPDTFTIEIQKSRGQNRPPKGVQTLSRDSIAKLKLQDRRIRGRAWGITLGHFLGLPLAYATAAAVWPGLMALGFFAGRSLDKATREVHIQP